MSRTFERMKTEAAMQRCRDLIGHTARQLDLAIESHGAHSIEAAGQHLILGYMRYLIGDFEGADSPIQSYITFAEERFGSDSDELFTGLVLLSNNRIEWGRVEESQTVFDRLKFVSQRCLSRRDPLLEGLYATAMRYLPAEEPRSETRGFVLLLMTLSWCVRHQSDTPIYEQYFPRLKTIFGTYGFLEDRWEWLVKHSNHNMHDVRGLISLLLDKGIVPLDDQPLTAEMREESLRLLVQEFPMGDPQAHEGRSLTSDAGTRVLAFVCSRCASRDLRTKMLVAHYPVSTLEGLEVNSETLEFEQLHDREDLFEWQASNHSDGWEFWCDKCQLVPNLEPYEEDETQEYSLARWLLDNCPQSEAPAATKDNQSA